MLDNPEVFNALLEMLRKQKLRLDGLELALEALADGAEGTDEAIQELKLALEILDEKFRRSEIIKNIRRTPQGA